MCTYHPFAGTLYTPHSRYQHLPNASFEPHVERVSFMYHPANGKKCLWPAGSGALTFAGIGQPLYFDCFLHCEVFQAMVTSSV